MKKTGLYKLYNILRKAPNNRNVKRTLKEGMITLKVKGFGPSLCPLTYAYFQETQDRSISSLDYMKAAKHFGIVQKYSEILTDASDAFLNKETRRARRKLIKTLRMSNQEREYAKQVSGTTD